MIRAINTCRLATVAVILTLIAGVTSAQQPVALVIGNSVYDNGPDLKNPVNDADAVSAELMRLGYQVYHASNLNYSQMSRMMLEFADKIGNARQVLVYFAGHGVQIDGVTYLMPTDAIMRTKADLITAITLNEVLDLLRGNLRASIVLVDACRDNPIYDSGLTRSFGVDSASTSRAQLDLPYGMVIGYASRPGAVAYDGPLQHSPFASALLNHMQTPGLDVELMLRRVRNQVVQITKGAQVPWTQSSLLGEVTLIPAEIASALSVATTNPVDITQTPAKRSLPALPASPLRAIKPQKIITNRHTRLVKLLCLALAPPRPAQCDLT